jgi:hypothetical protein
VPHFIGPFKVIGAEPDTSNYTLELSSEMITRNIHNRFHVALLKPYIENDSTLFPGRDAQYFYDVGDPEEMEWGVEEIVGHRWKGKEIEFSVRWTLGDTTWEPLENCNDLMALDHYLALYNVNDWDELPRKNEEKNKRQKDIIKKRENNMKERRKKERKKSIKK